MENVRLYRSKLGEENTKEGWLKWAKSVYKEIKYSDLGKGNLPTELWERVIRLLKLEVVGN